MPEMCAYWIYSGYRDSAMWENSLDVFIGSALDHLNTEFTVTPELKKKVKKLLQIKYNLITVNENPLQFE